MGKRVFLIVLDSLGIGAMPDAKVYGDEGSNTLKSVVRSEYFDAPNLRELGLFNIDCVHVVEPHPAPKAAFARLEELSKGKDTTIGHWEIAGVISSQPLPVFQEGFPAQVIEKFENRTGRQVLCNKPYSGTDVLKDYGQGHLQRGALIVYTSADSVFQIAAHEGIVAPEELYGYCRIARDILTGEYGVGRVIARPFIGEYPNFARTENRRDFSLKPPHSTMLDVLANTGHEVIAVGKIWDIFAGEGITKTIKTKNNTYGIEEIKHLVKDGDFEGLCFVNLVDFDMLYGHRNDSDGYARAIKAFDDSLPEIMASLREQDLLIITADHGCDPGDVSTDHTREYVPLLMYGNSIKPGVNLGTRHGFCDISATVLQYLDAARGKNGRSMLGEAAW